MALSIILNSIQESIVKALSIILNSIHESIVKALSIILNSIQESIVKALSIILNSIQESIVTALLITPNSIRENRQSLLSCHFLRPLPKAANYCHNPIRHCALHMQDYMYMIRHNAELQYTHFGIVIGNLEYCMDYSFP